MSRARLERGLFDFLVTNIRLNAYNGLQLVYLRSPGQVETRPIVYTDKPDPGLGRQVQRAGAFYETVNVCR